MSAFALPPRPPSLYHSPPRACAPSSSPGERRIVAKRHAAAALRGLSDSAAVAAGAELARSVVVGGVGAAGAAQAALAFGGLAGVWSGAFVLQVLWGVKEGVVGEVRGLGREMAEFGEEGCGGVGDIVMWLDALGGLEGAEGAHVLHGFEEGGVGERVELARGLGGVERAGNVVGGVLGRLVRDENMQVREAARIASQRLGLAVEGGANVGDAMDFAAFVERRGEIEKMMRDVIEVKAVQVENEVVTKLLIDGRRGADIELGVVGERMRGAMDIQTPLFDFVSNFELRALCALTALPLFYELWSASSNAGGVGATMVRLVGLGWLMSVAGFFAYPASARVWEKVSRFMMQEADKAREGMLGR